MEKNITKVIYIIIIVIEIIIIKKYNVYYQNKQEIKIERSSIEYLMNKKINPNLKEEIIKKEETIIEYEMILEIPKINLKKGILNKYNKDNNIEKNVTILTKSSYPNKEGNIFLVAHSGNGNKSFFNDLVKLSISDEAYLYHNNIKYIYKVKEINEISKKSNLTLSINDNNNLILITCSQKNKSKYLMLILEKQKETEF